MTRPPACTACGQPLIWALSLHGRPLPLNAAPDPLRGNVRIDHDGVGLVLAGQELDAARANGTPLYLSHFVDCPEADAFRKRKKAGW